MPYRKIKDPLAVNQAIEEFDEVGRTAFLDKYGFLKAREYKVSVSGTLYDAPALMAAAYGYAFPDEGPLPSQSDVGEAEAARALADLGYETIRVGQEWTREEVEATVADYFDMLGHHSRQTSYSKADHNARLRTTLKTRSKASIELKHQNISAVLSQLDLPYIPGYKPRSNLQGLLRSVVIEQINSEGSRLAQVMENLQARTEPGEQRYKGVLVDPPVVETLPLPTKRPRMARKYDYAGRDEHNRLLGHNGEAWVFRFEQQRLKDEDRPDLVSKIDWISDRLGDGVGYDILSYETTELARFIEVKTTNGGPLTPFIVSRNEKEVSDEYADTFCLYRVFEFASSPKLFILRGELSANLVLEAMDYRARLRELRS